MRKAAAIFFLVLFCLNAFGLFVVYELMRLNAKNIAAQELHSNSKPLLLFSDLDKNDAIIWEKKNKEFLFQGRLYDIARIEVEGTVTKFYCFSDEKETAVVQKLINLSKSLSNDGTLLRLMYWLAMIFMPGALAFIFASLQRDVFESAKSFFFAYFPSYVADIALPPPKHRVVC